MEKEKFDYQYLLFKIVIYSLTIGTFLFQWFGKGLIQSCKQKKEREQIMYGGSAEKVNKHIEKRNEKVLELNKLVNKELKNNPYVVFYTNDTSKNVNLSIEANRKHRDDYVNPYQIGRNYIQESQETIGYINDFLDKKDSLGFNIFYVDTLNENRNFRLQNVNKDTIVKYKIVQFYTYKDQQKERLAEKIEQKKYFIFKTKKEELEDLEKEQFAKIIISENELINQKAEDGFKALMGPQIGIYKNSTYYFSCYNQQMDEATFNEKVKFFEKMYIKKNKKEYKGQLKKLEVINSFNEYITE